VRWLTGSPVFYPASVKKRSNQDQSTLIAV
jgi:hypothetical protein